ncbi:prepilin peptidase [Allosaccharopolyspora coralli]|uniref:Prepilin peptidase n=1 Tax=Allosaccharopolyspora coralli TaxID=2665642 RepID=A0A5Q3Q5P2_9PSEU|nr:A24 family peptidase [Allosaccharopolyspora coralli]QGK69663.1 prepilin peptidase [Allosaccharopolyspora coralli]
MTALVLSSVVSAVVGGSVGRLGRRLLAWLRRGVAAPAGWCEFGAALVGVAVAVRTAGGLPWWWVPVPLAFGWWAILLAVCDWRSRRLPDALTLPAYPVVAFALAVALEHPPTTGTAASSLAGAVLFAGSYALVRWWSPHGLGAGDVKLAGVVGAVVGAVAVPAVLVVMASAAILTVVASARTAGPVAHGPAILVPAWLCTLLGPATQLTPW